MRYVRKFATYLSIALGSALLTYLLLGPRSAVPQHPSLSTFAIGMPVEKFPILPRFEIPRNYGFFIGDRIPLRLIIETTDDVVVNLENLPQKGQQHGPFEIADMQLSQHSTPGQGTTYRVLYALQYFGPTPLTAVFDGVEILYARVASPPQQTPIYKRVVTQSVPINMARLSPLHHTAFRQPEGAIQDQRQLTVWLGVVFTTLCLTVGGLLGCKAWQQKAPQPQASQTLPLTPENQDLHLPLVEGYAPHARSPEHATLMQRLRHTMQAHIQSVYGLPAASMSSAELAEQLPDHPDAHDIMSLLEWCDALPIRSPYQPYQDESGVCWDAAISDNKLQQVETT